MFERFDYPKLEAVARARILYYMQIGYDDAQLNEPMEARNHVDASLSGRLYWEKPGAIRNRCLN